MQLVLRDPAYTERLASFLSSVGQQSLVRGPDQLEVDLVETDAARMELELYLRVWHVLYPEADVQVAG
jgi:hypothetical protein